MYCMVQSARQQKQFETTWEYFCQKYNWYNDRYAEDGIRYVLLKQQGRLFKKQKVIGTIEFIPYCPNNPFSTVEGRFPFSNLHLVNQYIQRIWEIDKLCIHHDYQRKGYFQQMVRIVAEHARQHHVAMYVTLMEKKLYRTLKMSHGSMIHRHGEDIVGTHSILIPTRIDFRKPPYDSRNKLDPTIGTAMPKVQ
ncbi:GNAT family N-acetyltransferase [Ornithinibacillus gellani]|uniref:GNAT family N-acetyltransferase n=1 Tax=Ornithinibacillus gellani TaxID=2293253 RepID=UPI000F464543|nr:GNAT family N-acetyltransferase [Ornithinibacillus gellani]TQS74140.1 GNAT family N-acetyltransferase [Ornithinibacillus gellani]